jgi:MFS family permease
MYKDEGSSADSRRLSPATRNPVPGQNATETPPRKRWLAGPFARLLATNMTFGFAISCFYLLPKHLTAHYAASPGTVGAVMGIFGLVAVLAVPWLGRAVTAFGLARTIVVSELVLGASCLGFAIAGGPGPAMLALRALQGLATAGMMTAAVALVCELAPAAKLGQAMGLSGAASLIMNALAPAIAEPVAARFGFEAVFVMAGFAGMLGALLARRLPAGSAAAPPAAASVLAVPRKARAILLAMAAVGAGFYVAVAFLAPLALSRGMHAVRGFFVAYTVAALAIRLFGGPLTDRLGLARTAVVGMVVYGLFIALLAGVGTASLAPLGVGFGLAHGVLFPALMALLFVDADSTERANLAAIANGVMNVGLLSVLLFGQLANHVGLPAVFVLTGVLVAAAARLVPLARTDETPLASLSGQPESD